MTLFCFTAILSYDILSPLAADLAPVTLAELLCCHGSGSGSELLRI